MGILNNKMQLWHIVQKRSILFSIDSQLKIDNIAQRLSGLVRSDNCDPTYTGLQMYRDYDNLNNEANNFTQISLLIWSKWHAV